MIQPRLPGVILTLGFSLVLSTMTSAAEPIVIAHRGASGYLPEHTLEAVAMAHAQGAHYIEQDVVLSKDGVPVVLHDVQIDAVTDVARRFPERKRPDGRWYALDFTLAELQTLKVTERINPRTGEPVSSKRFPVGLGTFRIPTLEEELEFISGLNQSTGRIVGIYPEIKAPAWHREQGVDPSPIVLATLARFGYEDKDDPCYLQCFDFEEVRRIREDLGYRGRLVQLLGSPRGPNGVSPTSPEGLDQLARNVDGIGPALPLVLRQSEHGGYQATDLVRLAHERKLEVHPYTIRADALPPGLEGPEELFRLVFDVAGVDGVFTDHPDQGVGYLRRRDRQP